MNKVYEKEMYNKETKKEFLNGYPYNSQVAYRRIFLKSTDIEERLGKDLYDFNFSEIEHVLYDLRPSSQSASESNASVIASYIDWANNKGLTINTLSPMKVQILKTEDYKKYIATKPSEMFKTEEKIFNIEALLGNPQDKATLILPYFGVEGDGCEELLNLKAEDVDFENYTLKLRDNFGNYKRTIKIEHERVDYIFNVIIKDAIEEKRYYKKNNEMISDRPNLKDYNDLIDSDYVIRPSKTRARDFNQPAGRKVIFRRIAFMGEEFGIPTLKYIVRSGMLAMARKLWKRDGELGNKQYEEIMDFYNFKNRNNLREFINVDVIKEIYGDED